MKTEKQQPGRRGGTLNVGGVQPGSGRKKVPELRDVLDKVMGDDGQASGAVENLFEKLRALADKGNIRAIELLLSYTYGKPKQTISGDPEAPLFAGNVQIVFDGTGVQPITSEAQIIDLLKEQEGNDAGS